MQASRRLRVFDCPTCGRETPVDRQHQEAREIGLHISTCRHCFMVADMSKVEMRLTPMVTAMV